MRRLLLLALLALPASATTYTVCAAGCDYTTVQAAITKASLGDIIEVEAGETFEENITLPYKAGSDFLTIRSSAYASLPPEGTRVSTGDLANMPTLRPTGAVAVMRAGEEERRISQYGVNTTTDVITCCSLSNGKAVTIGAGTAANIPEPFVAGTVYYVVNASGSTFKLAATVGGAAIDILDVGSADSSSYYTRPWIAAGQTGHHYKFQGINFTTKAGSALQYYLIILGMDETSTATVPDSIEIHRSIITGTQDESGPGIAVALNGSNLVVRDSIIDHVKWPSYESKAFLMTNTPGPVLIENNFLSAASLGLLTGGQSAPVLDQVATGLTVRGNHIAKRGYMLYNSGAGAPTGACYYGNGSGRFYRDTAPSPNTCANGACYVCQADSTWAQDLAATYRNDDNLTKSGFEFKGCDNCLVEGNVIEGVFAAHDYGNQSCFGLGQILNGNPYIYLGDVTVRNNWCKDTWNGFGILTDGEDYSTQNYNVTVSNNLFTGMANYPAMSIYAAENDPYVRPINISRGASGIVVDHNTFRAAPDITTVARWGLILLANADNPVALTDSYVRNNIMPKGVYSVYADGSDGSCNATGFGLYFGTGSSPKYVANNVQWDSSGTPSYYNCNPVESFVIDAEADLLFVGSRTAALTDPAQSALQATSPYSAACTVSCAFHATDSTDVGVNVAALNVAIAGAISGLPTVRAGFSGFLSITGYGSLRP